jgi:hypothetical protein
MRILIAMALGVAVLTLSGCPEDSTVSPQGTAAPSVSTDASGGTEIEASGE